MAEEEKIEIHRGLKGIHFERSGTSFIDGKLGELRYCGYSIHDLAEHSTFEETAYLLLHGDLPNAPQLHTFTAALLAARHMRDEVEKLSREMGEPKWFAILQAVVEAIKPYARFGVNVNVDFYSGAIYYLNGIAPDLFVPVFAVGRIPGWTAQVMEQLANNILIRPLTIYDGPAPREYQPIVRR